jgi:hypothetical protein
MSTLTFRFRHSKADDIFWLIELATRGRFKELAIGPNQIVYETSFELLDPLQLSQALSLSTALVHHKTAEAFAGGQSLPLPIVREVLRCYQHSQQVEDAQTYCWFATAFRFDLTATTYTIDDAPTPLLFPCRLAARYVNGIHPEQPGTIGQQVDSALVRAGTRWCPRLADLTDWQQAASLVTKEAL